MALADDIKKYLRISSGNTAYDTEIADLIASAKADLILSGINTTDDATYPLIKRAVSIYCKANFGYNNPDALMLLTNYEKLKGHLMLTRDYARYTLTFTITDVDGGAAIREAKIRLYNTEDGYEKVKYTNVDGEVIFYLFAGNNYKYDISADDYEDDFHEDDDENWVDITGNTAVAVTLTGV